jgi:hypothetical protein
MNGFRNIDTYEAALLLTNNEFSYFTLYNMIDETLTLGDFADRNKIREAGINVVKVLRCQDKVIFSAEAGPWAFVSFEGTGPKHDRWIHMSNDPDFLVT